MHPKLNFYHYYYDLSVWRGCWTETRCHETIYHIRDATRLKHFGPICITGFTWFQFFFFILIFSLSSHRFVCTCCFFFHFCLIYSDCLGWWYFFCFLLFLYGQQWYHTHIQLIQAKHLCVFLPIFAKKIHNVIDGAHIEMHTSHANAIQERKQRTYWHTHTHIHIKVNNI